MVRFIDMTDSIGIYALCKLSGNYLTALILPVDRYECFQQFKQFIFDQHVHGLLLQEKLKFTNKN